MQSSQMATGYQEVAKKRLTYCNYDQYTLIAIYVHIYNIYYWWGGI